MLLRGPGLPFSPDSDRFGFGPDVPEADGEECEEDGLVQAVPEQLEKAGVEVDAQKGDAEAISDVVIMSQAVIDCPSGDGCK